MFIKCKYGFKCVCTKCYRQNCQSSPFRCGKSKEVCEGSLHTSLRMGNNDELKHVNRCILFMNGEFDWSGFKSCQEYKDWISICTK